MSALEYRKQTQDSLRDFQGNSTRLAAENIRNAQLRSEYIQLAKNTADGILTKASEEAARVIPDQAAVIWKEAAEEASRLRNEILSYTRGKVSKMAEALSKILKEEGKTFPDLIRSYTRRLYGGRAFSSLALAEQQSVYEAILKASGRTNTFVNSLSKWSGRIGAVFLLITIGIVIYNICESQNPVYTFVKSAVSLGFGAAGGYVGAELGAAIGACGGPVGVFIGAIVGGIIGGAVTAFAGDCLVDALYFAFCPSATIDGPGPPALKGFTDIYGQPPVRGRVPAGQPGIRGTQASSGQPSIRGRGPRGYRT